MIWQLQQGLSAIELQTVMPMVLRATDRTVERVVRRGLKLEVTLAGGYRRWAKDWLSEKDRTSSAAEHAAYLTAEWAAEQAEIAGLANAATNAAAWLANARMEWATENAANALKSVLIAMVWAGEDRTLQAGDLRMEIPVWPGKVAR